MMEDPEELELLVDRVLRGQPLRQAPATLEARVLARLPQPWWRKSFAYWPLAARSAFLIASYGFVRLALAGVMSVADTVRSGEFAGVLSPAMTWLHGGTSILSAAVSAAAFVARTVPAFWLDGAAVFGIALYVALFGLGAVAYRTLYVDK